MTRRYIFNKSLYRKNPDIITENFDVVVVGGGMAGLYTALEIDRKMSVAVVVKGDLKSGSSWLAQGGICCVTSDEDSFESHIEDTLAAGAGHCRREAVEVLVKEAPENIQRLIEYGVPFDRDKNGELHVTREGGHSHNRILHCGGDATGREITKALGEAAEKRGNIKILWNHDLVDILTDENRVQGVVVNNGKEDFIIKSGNVVIATGGAGQLYKYSTTPEGNTGEGIAACYRAGCKLRDMEFVQFHPTAFAIHGEGERVFLISEAVRGEGAVLRNKNGEAFMSFDYQHPLHDLAPRDVVTRAIMDELKRTGGDRVYLDASCMSREFFEERFPTITAKCRECGINPPKDFIPVQPTQHYLMGGVETDLNAKTEVEGLYVCGEAACTGVHGANRLASNSTLECIVFAKHAAMCINSSPIKDLSGKRVNLGEEQSYTVGPDENEAGADMAAIKTVMTEKVGAVRKMHELEEAREELSALKRKYALCNFTDRKQYAVYSAAEIALIITDSAYARKESLGSHYISE